MCDIKEYRCPCCELCLFCYDSNYNDSHTMVFYKKIIPYRRFLHEQRLRYKVSLTGEDPFSVIYESPFIDPWGRAPVTAVTAFFALCDFLAFEQKKSDFAHLSVYSKYSLLDEIDHIDYETQYKLNILFGYNNYLTADFNPRIFKRRFTRLKLFLKNESIKKLLLPDGITRLQKTTCYAMLLMDWRKLVFYQTNNLCWCGEPAQEAHHIIHKKTHPELSLNVNNGIGLCKKHHFEVHGKRLILRMLV